MGPTSIFELTPTQYHNAPQHRIDSACALCSTSDTKEDILDGEKRSMMEESGIEWEEQVELLEIWTHLSEKEERQHLQHIMPAAPERPFSPALSSPAFELYDAFYHQQLLNHFAEEPSFDTLPEDTDRWDPCADFMMDAEVEN